MTEQTEHSIEYIEVPLWQGAPVVQAVCACGWETKREQIPRSVVESAARRHLASVEES